MAAFSLSLSDVVDKQYWLKSAEVLEKTTKLSVSIVAVRNAYEDLDKKIRKLDLDVEFVSKDPAKEAEALAKTVEGDILKPLESLLSGPVKKLENEANKALGEAKKASKESAVKAITGALKTFSGDANTLLGEIRGQLKELAKGNKPVAKGDDAGDKKKNEAATKQIQRFNMMAKKAIRELRSGKVDSVPFVFAANKTKVPYKKGKDWTAKSLIHMHLKAGQSSRNLLAKMIDLPSPVFAIGEARCEDRKKIIFDCTKTPPANIKQLKDALLFQCGYAPALKVMKGKKVEGDEAGEGEDSGEPIGDIPDDDGDEVGTTVAPTTRTGATTAPVTGKAETGKVAGEKDDAAAEAMRSDVKQRFNKRTEAIKNAIQAPDKKKANVVRVLALEVNKEIKPGGDAEKANKLLKRLEDLLDQKITAEQADPEAESDAGGATGAGSTAAVAGAAELQAAVRELAALRARAVTGITRVAELIRRSYQGDAQAAKAVEGANKVDGAKRLLTPAVETQIAALLNTNNAAQRVSLAGTARTSVSTYRKSLAAHELLPDIDKSVFDPNLSVIEPYLKSLERAESLLGGIKA